MDPQNSTPHIQECQSLLATLYNPSTTQSSPSSSPQHKIPLGIRGKNRRNIPLLFSTGSSLDRRHYPETVIRSAESGVRLMAACTELENKGTLDLGCPETKRVLEELARKGVVYIGSENGAEYVGSVNGVKYAFVSDADGDSLEQDGQEFSRLEGTYSRLLTDTYLLRDLELMDKGLKKMLDILESIKS